MLHPRVSVIIPIYNVEKYLKQCLDSVINQSLQDIEIICIDDGSTDNSLKILEDYEKKDNRIIVIKQQNQYAGVARNNGLKIAKGEYLSFLDSDDWFDSNMLECMYNKAKQSDLDVVVCEYNQYDNNLHKTTKYHKINNNFKPNEIYSLKNTPNRLFDLKTNAWSKLFKRDLFIKNNICFDDTICYNDFTGVIVALAVANKIGIINKPFVNYRVNQKTSLTSTANKKFRFEVDLKVITSLYDNLKRLGLHNLYKASFRNRARKAFLNKPQVKNVLSNEIYCFIYNK